MSDYNDYSYFEDDGNIRPPDIPSTEQLLEDSRTEEERQLEEAMLLSLKETHQKIEEEQKYENMIIQEYYEEMNNRKTKLNPLLLDLHKISKYDKQVFEIYNYIIPIVDSYCTSVYSKSNFLIPNDMKEKIFNTINSIRTNKQSVELLKNIIENKL